MDGARQRVAALAEINSLSTTRFDPSHCGAGIVWQKDQIDDDSLVSLG